MPMNLKNNAKELFQDLDVYETRIIFCLINEPLTIYAVGLTWDKFLKTGVHLSVARSRIKGKRVNEKNLIKRGYVKLVREVPYKGKIKQFYGLTFKGLCAAYAYGKTEDLQKEFLKKLTDNWEEYGYSNEVEMRASLKLWLKYRLMIQKQGYSKIYVIQDWKEDFKLSGYKPFAHIMSEVAWRTMKVFPHYGPTIINFTRLFTDYGLDEDEAEALSKWVHESKILRLNRHHMEIMEIILNKKYDENCGEEMKKNMHLEFLKAKGMKKLQIICHTCEGTGIIEENFYPNGKKVECICPECEGRKWVAGIPTARARALIQYPIKVKVVKKKEIEQLLNEPIINSKLRRKKKEVKKI